MAHWIEVKARYERMLQDGCVKTVNEPYLVDALSCTEAEARVIKELQPYISGDLNITAATKTRIAEVFTTDGDRYYRVKVNFITIDERTGIEKRAANHIIVPADSFRQAIHHFLEGMRGTLADYEIESVAETKIINIYRHNPQE